MKRPKSKTQLDAAIQRIAGTRTHDVRYTALRTVVADVVVGQMLPDCAIKGGSSLKLRYGAAHTRFTMDFDAASGLDDERFVEAAREKMAAGWNGFTATLDIEKPAFPEGVPREYVMRPFTVHLGYCGKPWCRVRLELGHDEIGDADEAEMVPVASDIAAVFEELGFPAPRSVPLLPLKFQLAQKLHGLSEPGSTRVRDLVDIQLIMRNSPVDLAEARPACERLFAYRKRQAWPPEIEKGAGWDDQYAALRYDLPVLATADEAVAWVNDLVRNIAAARRSSLEIREVR